MNIYFVGGEQQDFTSGVGVPLYATSAITIRTGWARSTVRQQNGIGALPAMCESQPFRDGAVTSAWLRYYTSPGTTLQTNRPMMGLTLSGTSKGIFVATSAASANKLALVKYDGSTITELAVESGTTWQVGSVCKIDLEVANYGASATLNLYVNNVLLVTYSGNVSISGMSDFDSVSIAGTVGASIVDFAEVIVADVDTRPILGLMSLYPTANGTTQNWTQSAYTNINAVMPTDANSIYVNSADQDAQYALPDEPSGGIVPLVKLLTRAYATSDATPQKVSVGFLSGGSVAVGSPHALTVTPVNYEDYFELNPVTGEPWGSQSEINALQLNIRSET